MWDRDDPLQQIPQFTPENIKKFKKIAKEHQLPNTSIDTFCRLTPEKRKELGIFSPTELAEVEKVVKIMPVIDCEVDVFTEGEKEMTQTDAITIRLKLTLRNFSEKEFPGYVHSHNYPYLKKPSFWVIISDVSKDRTIMAYKVVFRSQKQDEIRLKKRKEIDQEPLNYEVIEFRQRFNVVNKFSFIATFISDSYVGFDQEVPINFEIVPEDPTRKVEDYNDEDKAAIKAPSFFQMALDQGISESETEDEDEQGLDDLQKLQKRLEKAGKGDAVKKNN